MSVHRYADTYVASSIWYANTYVASSINKTYYIVIDARTRHCLFKCMCSVALQHALTHIWPSCAQALKRKRLLSLLAAVSSEGPKQEEAAGESREGSGGEGAGREGGTVNKKRRCLGGSGGGGEGGTGSMLSFWLHVEAQPKPLFCCKTRVRQSSNML